MNAKTRAVLIAAALLPLAAGGCGDEHPVVSSSSSQRIDDPAASACTVFAAEHRRAESTVERLRLADEVGRHAARSDNGAVSGRAGLVGRSADRGDESWQAASRSLLAACRDAGWKPAG